MCSVDWARWHTPVSQALGRTKLENGELKASLGYSTIPCLKELEEKVPNTYCVTYTILNAFNIQANKKKIPALCPLLVGRMGREANIVKDMR